MTARALETPAPVAADIRHGHRPVVAASVEGAAAATGSTCSPVPDVDRRCKAHFLPAVACPYCEDPSLLLGEELIEEDDLVLIGVAWQRVARALNGRLVLEAPLNRRVDGGLL